MDAHASGVEKNLQPAPSMRWQSQEYSRYESPHPHHDTKIPPYWGGGPLGPLRFRYAKNYLTGIFTSDPFIQATFNESDAEPAAVSSGSRKFTW